MRCHHRWPNSSPRLKKVRVRQVLLDKWFPLEWPESGRETGCVMLCARLQLLFVFFLCSFAAGSSKRCMDSNSGRGEVGASVMYNICYVIVGVISYILDNMHYDDYHYYIIYNICVYIYIYIYIYTHIHMGNWLRDAFRSLPGLLRVRCHELRYVNLWIGLSVITVMNRAVRMNLPVLIIYIYIYIYNVICVYIYIYIGY